KNNPNDYAGGKYVFELLCRVIKLSEKSVDLIEKISENTKRSILWITKKDTLFTSLIIALF
ncbi:hypothetical protein, partial [Helicobacter pylori]|uniref:hypothetical protein n=1 Tax=Helicobacter pylori TaxID=210 RepID=UPI0027E486A1